MEFLKKNIIYLVIFFIGIALIYNSVPLGRSYFMNYIVRNNLESQNYLDILLNMSIIKYIIIGILLSIVGIKKIEK